MPGSLPAAEAAAGAPSIEIAQLGSFLVLGLGVALAIAPTSAITSLLGASAESAVPALLECAVYGYILLQVRARGLQGRGGVGE
jgi:hypothetical protein